MVRVRNEEKTLYDSIKSLSKLTIPHEIIIILHLCTDKSKEIAEKLSNEMNVKFYEYNIEVSRAGYETLATDVNSKHSFITYSNWCLSKKTLHWLFKWDADFIASPGLIKFINEQKWIKEKKAYRISAKNTTSNNCEYYLIGNMKQYAKYIFWEYAQYDADIHIDLNETDAYIIHNAELSDLKSYWTEESWYVKDKSEEASVVRERINLLVTEFGKEPIGMARASNPDCDAIFLKITKMIPNYVYFYS